MIKAQELHDEDDEDNNKFDIYELRIGSLLHLQQKSETTVVAVTGLLETNEGFVIQHKNWEDFSLGEGIGTTDELEPIMITPEWLERFGFNRSVMFMQDVYDSELPEDEQGKESAHYCYSIEGYDCTLVFEDHYTSMERHIAHDKELGDYGWYVSSQFEGSRTGIAFCYYVHQLQNLFTGCMSRRIELKAK